jgi:anti-sigma factor RsiW
MSAVGPFEDDTIQAYVDGRLPADRVKVVEAYLEQDPAEAARVARYIEQRSDLRTALHSKFSEPVPARLSVASIRADQRRRQTRRIAALAATIAIAIIGATAGWIAAPHLRGAESDPLVTQALSVRHGEMHPDRTVDAAALAAPGAGDQLIAATLAIPAKVPDLARAGYALAGILVVRDPAGGPGLQVAYRGPQGRSFTLYMHRSNGPDRFDLLKQGSLQICVWQDDDLSVVMLGEMPAKEMLKVATMTYSDLNF